MKTKIINVLPHIPDYEFLQSEPRPPVNWDTPDGNWVGIYRNEIPNKLGREVLKFTNEFEYEVWQPDYRADKIYSHKFEDGLVHRLFPAEDVQELHGFKVIKEINSPAMIDFLKENATPTEVVINLNGDFCTLNNEIIKNCGNLPLLQTFRGTINLPQTMAFKKRLNVLATINYLNKHFVTKRLIKKVDYVTYQNNLNKDTLEEIYRGPKAKLTSGCDFSFWKKLDKKASRRELGLPEDKTIFFTSSLLIMRKQIDKLLEVLKELDHKHDFLLLISGHGTEAYEKYLHDKAQPLLEKGKVRFVGFHTGDKLRKYYSSADLFINPSCSEGGPVSAMKALACETPLFNTNVGNVAESMEKNGSGILVGIRDYQQWKEKLEAFLSGEKVKLFDRKEAEKLYDWQKVAARFSAIYRMLHQQSLEQKFYPAQDDSYNRKFVPVTAKAKINIKKRVAKK